MKTPADKSPEPQRQAAAHQAPQQQDNTDAELQFVDNRAETASLRQLQAAADNSPQAQGLSQLSAMMTNSPRSGAMQSLQAMVDNSPRRASMVSQAVSGDALVQRVEDEEVLQGEFAAESPAQLAQPPEDKPNNTGLPDNLKVGVESLSGLSLDNVKVHYNSSKPAQLNAHAYAQGTDIHLGPGQEQHLPHEAWHVVQQAQGRVKPTMQMKDGVGINDDVGLEAEADLMGGRAVSAGVVQAKQESSGSIESEPIELVVWRTEKSANKIPKHLPSPPMQRVRINGQEYGGDDPLPDDVSAILSSYEVDYTEKYLKRAWQEFKKRKTQYDSTKKAAEAIKKLYMSKLRSANRSKEFAKLRRRNRQKIGGEVTDEIPELELDNRGIKGELRAKNPCFHEFDPTMDAETQSARQVSTIIKELFGAIEIQAFIEGDIGFIAANQNSVNNKLSRVGLDAKTIREFAKRMAFLHEGKEKKERLVRHALKLLSTDIPDFGVPKNIPNVLNLHAEIRIIQSPEYRKLNTNRIPSGTMYPCVACAYVIATGGREVRCTTKLWLSDAAVESIRERVFNDLKGFGVEATDDVLGKIATNIVEVINTLKAKGVKFGGARGNDGQVQYDHEASSEEESYDTTRKRMLLMSPSHDMAPEKEDAWASYAPVDNEALLKLYNQTCAFDKDSISNMMDFIYVNFPKGIASSVRSFLKFYEDKGKVEQEQYRESVLNKLYAAIEGSNGEDVGAGGQNKKSKLTSRSKARRETSSPDGKNKSSPNSGSKSGLRKSTKRSK